MDRENADFQLSLSSLCSQLASTVRYVPVHWPVSVHSLAKPGGNPSPDRKEAKSGRRSTGNHFMGLIDLVTMKFLVLGVFQMTGDQRESIDCATTGSIVALAGLQSTHSGDLLGPVRRASTSNKNSSIDQTCSEDEDHYGWIDNLSELNKCEPVVYAALEPGSLSAVRPLEYALACMQREDPSFTARLDAETGQWIVGGMGDLHLEVILSRLQREYKVDARIGPLLIAYKECPLVRSKQQHQQQTIRTSLFQGYGRVTGSVDGSEKVAFAIVSVEASEYPKPQ
ncbi:hypothetical protein CRM22_003032, partial [Opisthorchis felineus]